MGGPSKQTEEVMQQQQEFSNELMSSYSQALGENQTLLKSLQTTLQPILSAGPSQEGFSSKEVSALRSSAQDNIATNFQHAEIAAQNNGVANEQGVFTPNGATEALQGEVGVSAAQELSREESAITQDDYAQGSKNFWGAEGALAGVAGQYNPNAYASVANTGSEAASQTANEITQDQNSWMNTLTGALGGIAGTALGNGGALTKMIS